MQSSIDIVKQNLAAMPQVGIRPTNVGGWAAVNGSRLIDSFTGPGAKAAAIKAAGTNRRVDQ